MAEIREIPISAIDPPESPVRTWADEDRIYQLADSIKHDGLIHPIVVRPKGDRFEVIAGHRRLIACTTAGFPTIPAIICDADDARVARLRLEENFQREDVNVVDEALYYKKLIDKFGWTIPQIAEKLRRSEEYVRSRLEILDWDPEFLEALSKDHISLSAAKPLTKITDRADRLHYLDAAVRAGASQRVTLGWLQAWTEKRPTEPPPPETIPKQVGEEIIPYCTEPCWVCGELVPVDEAFFPTCHRQCYMDLQRMALQMPQQPPLEEKKE